MVPTTNDEKLAPSGAAKIHVERTIKDEDGTTSRITIASSSNIGRGVGANINVGHATNMFEPMPEM
jgi:hypothetical protein